MFNEALNDRLDKINFQLEGVPDLEYCKDDFDLPQWDSTYRDNTEYWDTKERAWLMLTI